MTATASRRGGRAAALWERLADPEGPLRLLAARGPWLWAALALGAAVRTFLLVFTEGTHDVTIWQSHAGWTYEHGLVGYYDRQEVFNHPPFIGKLLSGVWLLSRETGLPFRVLLRAPFALLDLANAALLLRLFAASPWRYLVFATYWLHPLSVIFSSYHGNTDAGVAFFVLLAVLAASRERVGAAALALGLGLWIKLPVLFAAPALFFYTEGWRRRLQLGAVALAVGASTYLPVLLRVPQLLYERVLAYPGMKIESPGGTPIWGWPSLVATAGALPESWRPALEAFVAAYDAYNTAICLIPIVALAWLRRRERTSQGLGGTVCGGFAIFYGFTNLWAFQYLAWSIPFWFFSGVRWFALASLLVGGYVYAAYALFCGNPFLLGPWDFRAHAQWPGILIFLRDASVLLWFLSAWKFLGVAAVREWRLKRVGGRASSP